MSCSQIRARARENLGNQIFSNTWLYAVIVTLIVNFILGAVSFTGIGATLLTGPLYIGMSKFFLSLSRGSREIKIEDTFSGFTTNLGDNIILGLLISLFTFLWSLLFIIPSIIKAYSYAMSYYIKNDHPDYTWQQCIDESRRIMDGNKARLFLLDFSFIGWIIVGAICFGIGTLWVIPYMEAARAVFYEEIKDAQ